MANPEAPFEEPLVELRRRIEELEGYPPGSGRRQRAQEGCKCRAPEEVGSTPTPSLTRWEKVPWWLAGQERPYTLDYIEGLMTDWVELHGDRSYADDPAIVAGLATFDGSRTVAVDRPPEGPRSTKLADLAQLRPAPAGGLPQGAARHAARRALRPAGDHLRRHPGRLSRASAPRSAARPRRSPAT